MDEYWDDSYGSSVLGHGNDLLLTTVRSGDELCPRIGSSQLAAIFLVINAALGAGLLNIPQAFDLAGGIVTALVVQAILLLWIIGALLILARCAENVSACTLQEVLAALCGNTGLIACSVVIALYCFGTCITFLIIIGDQFDRVLSSLYGEDFCHFWYMNRRFTITVSSIFLILPLCYSKRIDFLKYVSSVGVVAVLYVVALIVSQKYTGGFVPGPIKTAPEHWTDIFLVVPVICFGYQCHVSVIPIYSCLKDRNLKNFAFVIFVAIVICVMCYSLAGIYGYLTFGSDVSVDILLGYSASDPFVVIGIVAIAIKTCTTYPILLFCGREAVSTFLTFIPLCNRGDVAVTEPRRRVFIVSVWFFLSLVLAVLTPNIEIVIDVLGSLAAVFIFIFPGICLMQSTLHRDPHILLNIDKLLIFISVLFFLIGAFVIGVVVTQIPDSMSLKAKRAICI